MICRIDDIYEKHFQKTSRQYFYERTVVECERVQKIEGIGEEFKVKLAGVSPGETI